MGSYGSTSTEQPGQYPAPSFTDFGLPAQNFGSGAAGSAPQSKVRDQGATNEPGQYPAKETFTGVPLGGSGAPGTGGVPYDGANGPDSVTYSAPTFYKGMREDGDEFSQPDGTGYQQFHINGAVSGTADWTQANPHSYGGGWDMPGVSGNTPTPGSGQHQTSYGDSSGHVMYGGFLKGGRPSQSGHPSFSGPGT